MSVKNKKKKSKTIDNENEIKIDDNGKTYKEVDGIKFYYDENGIMEQTSTERWVEWYFSKEMN
tara:strand:+ start:220 stop:408 length:189 start_codon:yes stop_codon:yes gene_type:complete